MMNSSQQNLSSLSPIRTSHPYSSSYVKQPVYQGNTYVNITPPRLTPVMLGTPSTAQTAYSANNSAPNRFNQALDQVCMLGHEMDTMRKNFELVQIELEQWKEKCGLIKAIAQTPPPGTNYSPTRVTRLKSDVQNQFQNYQQEITKLNTILQNVSADLTSSSDKIRSLERRVEEMNKIELEMLQAKKTALELDNQNRFQALTLNDLKSKVDSTSTYNMELEKKLAVIPHLQENISILEEENRKMAAIIQAKDDQIQRQDQKHIQLTRMYQENLEKTNQIATQLREALNENEELHGEVDRTHNIAESIKEVNIQNSIYLQKQQQQPIQAQQQRLRSSAQQGNQEEQLEAKELKGSAYIQNKLEGSLNRGDSLKRSQSSVSQSRGARNSAKLSLVQSAMLEQQTNIDQLQSSIRDKDQRLTIAEKEKSQLMNQISDLSREIGQLKNEQRQQQVEHEDSIMKQKREFSDNYQNQIIPLQNENQQMRLEIEQLENEIANVKAELQHVQDEKALLEEQMNKERQQSYNIQQKLSKDNEIKCDQLTERLIAKEGDLSEERLKNQELFEDNKLMAEEMRILKQKAIELELWKNKYRDLKKETKALRSQFEEYKQNFIREIQTRFSTGCDQFDNCLRFIDEKFDSARNAAQIQQQLVSQPQENSNIGSSSHNIAYQQSPVRSYSQNSDGSDLKRNPRNLSPAQERLKVMKQTPSRSSAVNVRSSSPFVDPTVQQGQGVAQGQQQSKGEIINGQANRYQKEITQTNEQLDNKLGELVVLKAKYEEALNRVQQNINSTPKK